MSNNEFLAQETTKDSKTHKGYKGFQSGNKFGKGRKAGSRSKAQIALDIIGEENAQAIYEVMINRALQGDFDSGRYILDKILPNRKGRYVNLSLPHIDTIENVAKAQDIIVQHVAEGEITMDEAEKLSTLVEHRRKTIETCEVINIVMDINRRIDEAGI